MFQPPAAKERSEEHTIFDPVRPTERIQVLDILRGWAVFGMLVVNVGYFTSLAQPRPVGADAIAAVVVQILAAGKFWTLFSILFGYGFALQLDRAAGGGIPLVAVYARRLVILLLFGLAHTLLHPLEILHRYALLGFLLIPLRRVSARALVAVGVVSLLLPVGAAAVGSLGQAVNRSDGPALTTAGAADREQAEAVRIYSTGSLPELVSYNARRFRRVAVDIRVLAPFPYFLFGFYLGRRRLLEAVGSHLTVIRKARWWALGLGLGLQAAPALTVLVPGEPGPSLQAVVRLLLGLGSGLLGLFYASVIVLLAQTPRWARRLDPFAAAGRLALTNYSPADRDCDHAGVRLRLWVVRTGRDAVERADCACGVRGAGGVEQLVGAAVSIRSSRVAVADPHVRPAAAPPTRTPQRRGVTPRPVSCQMAAR